MNTPSTLGRGERAPDFVLPLQNGTPTQFYARAGGNPTLLIFVGKDQDTDSLNRFLEILKDEALSILTVQQSSPPNSTSGPPVFTDQEGAVRKAYRLEDDHTTVILALNPNLRVLSTHILDNPDTAAQAIRATVQTLPTVAPIAVTAQAPVLLISDILDSDICHTLIQVWQTQGHEETGVEHSIAGQRKDAIDPENKSRKDHMVTDPKLMRLLTSTVGRRVMPELQKAFHYKATRFEGFKIACYAAEEGGFFHAHRDNLSPSTAHRRFALTLNLNDAYEGGHLRFPEYGPHLYRPPAGDAVIFSSSHLHEVTPVTSGR
ncbi:MAG: 2OG-Fe(II) oxygenase, partial [bacterium]|nr:2OG-Fe(II) oxygenase [bacterium]